MKTTQKQLEIARKMRSSVVYFIKGMWKLYPQPVKEEYKELVKKLIKEHKYEDFRAEYFEPFVLGKHITWQQYQVLLAIEDAENGINKKKITIRAGRGVGKSCALAWVVIWYLYTHPRANVPCTAPNQTQMYDVLWKYLAAWVAKMPQGHKEKFDVQGSYLRVTEQPKDWFARARTARKESPEALAGLHSKYMLMIVDEASGVDDEIIKTGEESLTEEKYIMILISNPTRLIGHFYRTHKDEKYLKYYRPFRLNAEESPVVNSESIQEIINKHGKDSDEYRVSVLGEFPREDAVDQEGYVPLLFLSDIKQVPVINQSSFSGRVLMGIDPAGEGKDYTSWVVRDAFKAKIVLEEKVSTPKTIASRTVGLMDLLGIKAEDIYVDMFGIGAETVKELYFNGKYVNSVMVGDQCEDDEDKERFINRRACYYFKLRSWIKSGGELEKNKAWEGELSSIRYRRSTGSQRLQIMSKREARKKGYHSPNNVDALMLTFSDGTEDYGRVETITPGNFMETIIHSENNRHSAI